MENHRPTTWNEYVGQTKLKTRLMTHIAAAKASGRYLDHLLLAGPPGIGKTTLARLVAQEREHPFESMVMPVKIQVLHQIGRKFHGVLFLDEVHRLPSKVQEELLSFLEDNYFQLSNGSRLETSLTVVGATTEPGDIIPPLYDRFVLKPMFEPYSEVEMEQMVAGMAKRENVKLTKELTTGLAGAAAGIPRNARSLVLAARALHDSKQTVNVIAVLDLAGLTADGLSESHVEYLRILDALGGKAGLSPIATVLRLHPKVVTELERLLLEKECITFTSSGRELTGDGYTALARSATDGETDGQ